MDQRTSSGAEKSGRVRMVAAAVFLLAATVPAAVAAPARPTADLSMTMLISKMAEGADGKGVLARIHNAGPGSASRLSVTLDLSGLDDQKLEMSAASRPCGDTGVIRTCDMSGIEVPAGGNVNFQVWLTHRRGTGPGGTITATVVAAGTTDPDTTNNTSNRSIDIGGHGPDIVAFGEDGGASATPSGQVPVGGLIWTFVNTGDEAAVGIRFTAALSPNVTFGRRHPLCTYGPDGRTARCELPDLVLGPGENIQPIDESGISLVVDTDRRGTFAVPGGTVTGEAMWSAPTDESATPDTSATPSATTTTPPPAPVDVDPGDNGYTFAIRVTNGATSPPPPPSGLPVTGARAALIAAIGLIAAALGLTLIAVARSRTGRSRAA